MAILSIHNGLQLLNWVRIMAKDQTKIIKVRMAGTAGIANITSCLECSMKIVAWFSPS